MTVLSQIREHRIRALKSLAMYTVFCAYGLTGALLGPTMLDLQLLVSGTIEQVAYVLPGRSVGIVTGSLISEYTDHLSNIAASLCAVYVRVSLAARLRHSCDRTRERERERLLARKSKANGNRSVLLPSSPLRLSRRRLPPISSLFLTGSGRIA